MIRTKETVKEVVVGEIPPNFKGSVRMRIKEASFAPSKSSGKPQLTWKCEIVHPLTVRSDYDGKEYSLDAKEVSIYLSLSETNKDGDASDNLYYLINNLHPMLGLPPEIDDENPNLKQYENICFEVILSSKERKEQRKLPNGSRELIKDAEGKEIIRGNEWNMIGIKDILRKVNMTTNSPF